MSTPSAPGADLLTRLRALPTAALSDALDTAGISCALDGITPLSDSFRAVGPAFTVRYAPVGSSGGTVGDFLDDVAPGAVIVIDNSARTDVTVWGGIMSQIAATRRIGGTVINGVCRDVAETLAECYPIFSCGRFMRTGKDRVRLESVGQPLTVAGVDIEPGTIICADADGVIAIPEHAVAAATEAAERIEAVEAQIVEAVRGGVTLREARGRYGYHELQRKR
jgi:regulator of RNase E activity RraA